MKAVLYLRYSSDRQTEQSIEGQRRVCTEYATKNGIEILGEYVDRAASASKDVKKRTDFLRMIEDSNRKSFDAVLVYKLDRFARERYEEAIFKHKLKENGVKVISATESIPDDPTGVILEALISGMNQYYSMELSQKTKRGMKESALKGNSTGGTIPYGYRSVNKKLVVDEQEAAVLRELFSRYAQGEMLTAILRDFGERGITSRSGSPISKKAFQGALRNKKYAGIYTYNNEVEIPNGCPAIIDEDTFARVQERLEANKFNKSAVPKKHVKGLSGKVYCGECGEKAKATSGSSKTGTVYYYFQCPNKCFRTVNRDALEDAVFNKLCQEFTPEKIEKLANEYVNTLCNRVEAQYNIVALKGENEDLMKMESHLLDKFIAGTGDDEVLVKKVKEIQVRRQEIKKKIKSAGEIVAKQDRGDIVRFLSEVIEGKTESPEFRQKIFDRLVDRVYIYDDGQVVYTTYIEDENKDNPLHTFSFSSLQSSKNTANGSPRVSSRRLSSIVLGFYFYRR